MLNAKREKLPRDRAALWVLFHLCNRANIDNDYKCCPGTKTVAEDTGFSERYAINMLNLLESEGWFRRVREGKFFRYDLDVERILRLDSKHPRKTRKSTEQSSVVMGTVRAGRTELSVNSTEVSAISTELSANSTELSRRHNRNRNSFETLVKPWGNFRPNVSRNPADVPPVVASAPKNETSKSFPNEEPQQKQELAKEVLPLLSDEEESQLMAMKQQEHRDFLNSLKRRRA